MEDTITITRDPLRFVFKKMSAEATAGFIARLKARWNYHEVIRKELQREELVPVHERDEKKYLALLDKEAAVMKEIAVAMEPFFEKIVEPDRKALLSLAEKKESVELLSGVMNEYFATLFPSEEERKKS